MKTHFKILFPIFIIMSNASCVKETTPLKYSPELTENEINNWNTFVGKWYGSRSTENDSKTEWLDDRKSDRTYLITFKITDSDGKVSYQCEKGYWGYSGGVYFTIYTATVDITNGEEFPTDNTDPYNRDAYNVIKLSGNYMKYVDFRSKQKFEAEKKSDEFILK